MAFICLTVTRVRGASLATGHAGRRHVERGPLGSGLRARRPVGTELVFRGIAFRALLDNAHEPLLGQFAEGAVRAVFRPVAGSERKLAETALGHLRTCFQAGSLARRPGVHLQREIDPHLLGQVDVFDEDLVRRGRERPVQAWHART